MDVEHESQHLDHEAHHQEHEGHHHESHHQEHEGHHHHHHDEPMTQEEAVRSLLLLGEVATSAGDYESAVEAYASILKMEPNVTALYNLGSFRARGLGIRRDYVEAARLFHQAELLGNERAGKLCGKCLFDYVLDGFDGKTPADLYAATAVFVSRVYPEADDPKAEVNNGLRAIAATLYNRGGVAEAEKAYRAAAEFGRDEYAQYILAALEDARADQPEHGLDA